MADNRFQPDNGAASEGVKITPLMRAKDLSEHSQTWQIPDLQSEIAKEANRAFERMLAAAREDVAQALAKMKEAELAQARAEGLAEGRAQGYEAGYAQGYQEAKAVVDADFKVQLAAWHQEQAKWLEETKDKTTLLLSGLTRSLGGVEDALLQDMIWLTGEMAQRLVIDALTIAPERVQALVQSVVASLPQVVYPLHIRLHPEDVALVDSLLAAHEGRVELHADAQLTRGECVVRSGHSEVSLNWKQQTSKVIDAALQSLATESVSTLNVAT